MNIIYYHSQEVIKKILKTPKKRLSGLEISTPLGGVSAEWDKDKEDLDNELLKTMKDIKMLNGIDRNLWRFNELYKFSYKCTLTEEFTRLSSSCIKVQFKIDDLILSGYTSIGNWISQSYLNNLLSIGEIEFEGFLSLLSHKDSDTENNHITVQYVLIGEKGIL